MAFKLAFVALTLTVITTVSAAPERIVDGSPTTIEQFPYVAAFTYTYPGPGITVQRCVGAILSSFHIVTTGFCFTGAILENMKVRAGSTNSLSGGEVRDITRVIKHPDYVEAPRAADLAVTVISNALFMTGSIGTLFLPAQNQYIADYTSVKVVSWGFESEQGPQLELLKTVNLLKIPLVECQERYNDVDRVAIEDPVICAGDQGAQGMCMGDSGAPMALGQVLVGISSFYKDCGDPTYPDVFTRIDRYTNWILEVATAPNVRTNDVSAVRTSPVVYQ